MNDDALAKRIILQMRTEVPEQYTANVQKFEDLVAQGLMRAAYAEADELRRKQNWQPSAKLEGMILRFQQVF
jgi:hypothetical protein